MTAPPEEGGPAPYLVAVQGVEGCFSAAAAQLLAPRAGLIYCRDFAGVFARLLHGKVARAVIPVENSLVGPIAAVAALLRTQPVHPLAEHWLPIDQCLIVPPGAAVAGIRRVLSHPVALAQCRRYLSQHPEWTEIPFFDTAGSVAEIMRRGSRQEAAIAGPQAAKAYGAVVAAKGIGDRSDNRTRFLLLIAAGTNVKQR